MYFDTRNACFGLKSPVTQDAVESAGDMTCHNRISWLFAFLHVDNTDKSAAAAAAAAAEKEVERVHAILSLSVGFLSWYLWCFDCLPVLLLLHLF